MTNCCCSKTCSDENRIKILFSDPFSKELPGMLEEFGEVTDNKDEFPEADIVLIRSKTKITKEYVDKAKNLKMVIRGGVGLDNVDLEYCKSKGIIVHNTPTASSIAVAELAFTHMLAIQRNLVKAHNTTKNGDWIKKQLKGHELYKKTLGLLGIGRIGAEVTKRAIAFGMTVIAFDPYVKEAENVERVELDDLFKRADFISIHAPLTKGTKNLVNKESIDKMKDGVIIINTARGKIVNEEDICEALKSEKVKYFGTDVYHAEPPTDSPLLNVENVLMTPHLGAQTFENMDRIGEIIIDLIKNFKN